MYCQVGFVLQATLACELPSDSMAGFHLLLVPGRWLVLLAVHELYFAAALNMHGSASLASRCGRCSLQARDSVPAAVCTWLSCCKPFDFDNTSLTAHCQMAGVDHI